MRDWGADECPIGRPSKQTAIESHWRASPRLCRRSFRLPCSRAPSAAHSYPRRRGWRSIPIGAPIQSALIACRAPSQPAAEHRRAGPGSLVVTAKAACRPHSERLLPHIERAPTRGELDPAVYADSQFTASAGMLTYGALARTRMRLGIALA
jgi:hypothetical protein